MLNGLDLFSGIGGITLALSPWVTPVAYCENKSYAQRVLVSRMADGSLPKAPIWDDVRTLRGDMLPAVDIIYGGFPCQDISIAGRGKGLEGERAVKAWRESEADYFLRSLGLWARYDPASSSWKMSQPLLFEDLIVPCVLAGCWKGGRILDPFMGAGTTLRVAKNHQRQSIGIELNEEYIKIAVKRLRQEVLI
jgi:hypothetical protein